MTLRALALVLVLSLLQASCATHWREDATAATLKCPSDQIVTSDHTAGAMTATWHAQCNGKVYFCSVPAAADPSTPPICKETDLPPTAVAAPVVPAAREEAAPIAPAASAPATPRAEPAASASRSDLEDKLQILKRAHDQGLITDQEYESKRRALLDAF